MHIYLCICICTHLYIPIYVCKYTYPYINTYMQSDKTHYICVRMYVFVYICICVLCACMRVHHVCVSLVPAGVRYSATGDRMILSYHVSAGN